MFKHANIKVRMFNFGNFITRICIVLSMVLSSLSLQAGNVFAKSNNATDEKSSAAEVLSTNQEDDNSIFTSTSLKDERSYIAPEYTHPIADIQEIIQSSIYMEPENNILISQPRVAHNGAIVASGTINVKSSSGTKVSGLSPDWTYTITTYGYYYFGCGGSTCYAGSALNTRFLNYGATSAPVLISTVGNTALPFRYTRSWEFTPSSTGSINIAISDSNYGDNSGKMYYRIEENYLAKDQSLSPESECYSNASSSQKWVGGPIDTYTGNYSYQSTDIDLPTDQSNPLHLKKTYTAMKQNELGNLGYGWMDANQQKLVFSDDPSGKEGYIILIAGDGSLLRFLDVGSAFFLPAAGISAKLSRSTDTSGNVIYLLNTDDLYEYVFSEDGYLLSVEDENGKLLTYQYTNGSLQTVTDESTGRSLTYSHNTDGLISNVTDSVGRSISYAYDSDLNLISLTDVLGHIWTYAYDDMNFPHLLTEIADPNGHTVERTVFDDQARAIAQYDGNDNLIVELEFNNDNTVTLHERNEASTAYFNDQNQLMGITYEDGTSETRTYNSQYQLETITDRAGNQTQITWQACNAPSTITDAGGNVTTMTYDSNENVTSVLNARGFTTDYVYGNTSFPHAVTEIIDPFDKSSLITYDAEGHVLTNTDKNGQTITYTYDEYGQITSKEDALGNVSTYLYNDLGLLTNIINPNGMVIKNEFNDAGWLVSTIENYDFNRAQNESDVYNITTIYEYDSIGNLQRLTDTYGNVSQYYYDNNNKIIRYSDPAGNEYQYDYDIYGNVTSEIDQLGHSTTYTYDLSNRIVGITNASGNSKAITYNINDTIASVTDERGYTTSFTYDALKRVIGTTDPFTSTTEIIYDEVGNVTQATDESGNITVYTYDALNQLIKTTDAEGGETVYFYDDAGNLIQVIDPRDNATTFSYNEVNEIVKITDTAGHESTFSYNDIGQLVSFIDANGHDSTLEYDALGRQVSIINHLNQSTSLTYDALGNITSYQDPLSRVWDYEYDVLSRVIRESDPMNGETTYSYNAVGNVLSTNNVNGQTTSYAYDNQNQLLAITDANNHTTHYQYDANGNVVLVTDAAGNETNYSYDSLNRQTSFRDAQDNTSQMAYDAVGNLVSITDANGNATHYEYDGLNQLLKVIENYVSGATADEDTNVTTEYTYDENGNLLTVTDANGHVDTYTYNTLNQLSSETDAIGNTKTYSYDGVGNLVQLIDANNATIIYDYDELNRIVKIDYPEPDEDVTFTYDAAGQVSSMADGLGTTSWTYDDLGRPLSITDPQQATVSYAYDAIGNRTGMVYPDGKTISYAYDSINQLLQVTDWEDEITSYSYNNINQLTTVSLPNDITSTYKYDPTGKLLTLTHQNDKETFASYEYTYDGVGNITHASETVVTPGIKFPDVKILVKDADGNGQEGITVYAFDGNTYANYSAVTDENGQASLVLPFGDYRFRADFNGTQFWSGDENHCTVEGCHFAEITVMQPVTVSVKDHVGDIKAGLNVYAFDGTTYAGYSKITDENGQAAFSLPEGNYRFRADFNGTNFWSADEENVTSAGDTCTLPGCTDASVTVSLPITVTVTDTDDNLMENVNVYVFTGTTYQNFSKKTDENGEVEFSLPEGEYRFRADYNGPQFWSDTENSCTIPGCNGASVVVTQPVTVTVLDTNGAPQSDLKIYAFDGSTYKGYSKTTDIEGVAAFTLPQGNYRFRANLNGTQFWSSTDNNCTLPGCVSSSVTVTIPMQLVVQDALGNPQADAVVYAFTGTTYSGYSKQTNTEGMALFTLPEGNYRFRVDLNGQQTWSDTENHCSIPGCELISVVAGAQAVATETQPATPAATSTPTPLENTSTNTPDGTNTSTVIMTNTFTPSETPTEMVVNTATPQPTATVIATFTETTTTMSTETPEGLGKLGGLAHYLAKIRLAPLADDAVVSIQVNDTDGTPKSGLHVYVFDGTTYSGISGITGESGSVDLTLPEGDYRFRADLNGTQFWSGTENTCSLPGCTSDAVTVTKPVSVTVLDSDGSPKEGLNIYAFNDTTYSGYSKVTDEYGMVTFTLPMGDYRFRGDLNGTYFWSAESNHCTLPGCESAQVTVTKPMTVTVVDSNGTPQEGVSVYAFDGTTYANFSKTTDAAGEAVFTLPEGDYRFRGDLNGTHFWSAETNHCTLPGCTNADITVTSPINISVVDTDGTPQEGLVVYAFNDTTYVNFSGTTDVDGSLEMTLPEGDYRFRADLNGTQFWSRTENHCTLPGCTTADVTVTKPLTVTIVDTDGTPQEGLNIYAFNETTYTNYSKVTTEDGTALFTLPEGDYRFRADLNGTQFWSAETNHCTLPGCDNVDIGVTKPVTVHVVGVDESPFEGITVYAITDDTYTNHSGVSDENGEVIFSLLEGDYHFRADVSSSSGSGSTHFWSSEENSCSVPGCITDEIILPGGSATKQTTEIAYTYNDLYRLTVADYDDETYYHYSYDAAGNILSQQTQDDTNTYTYDAADRISSVVNSNGTYNYSWDGNGNLISDGTATYTYNTANRMTGMTSGADVYSFAYNGLGDRYQQTINGESTTYQLDLATNLTQVLSDGVNTYLYGLDRIAQLSSTQTGYFLPDAIGSVRQVVDPQAHLQLAQSFTPFGEERNSSGEFETPFGFAGEQQDVSGLLYLRARYLSTSTGRFTSVDPFYGYLNYPASMNPFQYAYNNPLRYVDRTGEWVIPALIIGSGLLAGGIEAYTQYQQNGCIDWGKVGLAAIAGAGAMAVGIFAGWAVVTGGAAIFGESLLATIVLGVGSGIISGQASRLTANLILGNPLNEGLGNPKDLLIDGVLGGIGGAVGYGLGKLKLAREAAKAAAAETEALVESADDVVKSPITQNEITTYQDFLDRSVVGDNLEGHEIWQHANLKANNLATNRLSTPVSKNNPVIAVEKSIHKTINRLQSALDAANQTPYENIIANAEILSEVGIPIDAINDMLNQALQHMKNVMK